MTQPTIKERYYQNQDYADTLLCEVITSIIEIPEVRRAVMVAGLDSNYYLRHKGVESMSDLPFQILWDHIMGQETIRTTPINKLLQDEENQS